MIYRTDKYGNQISSLGFGCLRFPPRMGHIDMGKTEAQILAAKRRWVRFWRKTGSAIRCILPPSCPII